MKSQSDKWNPQDEPIYWFAILEKALDAGNLQEAALAQRELARLGYTLRYRHTKESAKPSTRGNQ